METEKSENETTIDLFRTLNDVIFALQQNMVQTLGMNLYRPKDQKGFNQSEIYALAGKNDNVVNIRFFENSESAKTFGDSLTVCFVYTLKERQLLEENQYGLDNVEYIKAKDLLNQLDKQNREKVATIGILLKDIKELIVAPDNQIRNTFTSTEKRDIKTLDVRMNVSENGDDIRWVYGFLDMCKSKGIALTPEENADYLAYKLILDKDNLTREEMDLIFDEDGAIKNNRVSLAYLLWKKQANKLKENDIPILDKLLKLDFNEKFGKTEEELKKMGLSWKKLFEKNPDKASFLLEKILHFHEIRYNITGKHLLYCSFSSFLHVYLRHVEELKMPNQFENRDKFQLQEPDVMAVMGYVMRSLNDDYQTYKDSHPTGRFFRSGKMAYYYEGDYYNVDVNPDGSISTFYKGSGKKQ